MNTYLYEKKYIENVEKRACELFKLPMPSVAKEAYLSFFETGNRLEYERIYFARREYLTVFGLMAEFFSEKHRENKIFLLYIGRLLDIIEDIMDEPTWVLPAHGSPEHIEGKRQSIDLFAAETAGSLAEILYLAEKALYVHRELKEYSDINKRYKRICLRFNEMAVERILHIFLGKNPCDWWENAGINWTSVCGGNIGILSHYMKYRGSISDSEHEQIMDRVTDSMICYLNAMRKDGVCDEGVGYYKYGMEYFLKFYEILIEENRQHNIERIGDFHSIALFLQKVYLGKGSSVNFSDCQLKNKTKMGMLSILSYIYNDVRISEDFTEKAYKESGRKEDINGETLIFDIELMEIMGGEECHRWLGGYYDYIWVKRYGSYLKTEESRGFCIFPKTQWYIRKWDNGTGFYIKGGHNAESHNHNDVGSFGYILNGEEILCDLGAGEYTREYFGDGRYEIFCNSSEGHNIPVIEGEYQRAGREYCADMFIGDESSVTVSFGGAYGTDKGISAVPYGENNNGNAVYDLNKSRSAVRKVTFSENGGITIRDEFCGAGNISERLITKTEPQIEENSIILKGNNSTVKILFSGDKNSSRKISLQKKNHRNHMGQDEEVYIICADYICGDSGKKITAVLDIASGSASSKKKYI